MQECKPAPGSSGAGGDHRVYFYRNLIHVVSSGSNLKVFALLSFTVRQLTRLRISSS